jgi:hypothetical protein
MACITKYLPKPPPPPPDYPDIPETSQAMFFEKNPYMELIARKRDDKGGIFKWIDIAIFGYLLFIPAVAAINEMKEGWVVVFLFIIVGLLMLFKFDYAHLAESWFICISNGIILDLEKTHKAPLWLKTRAVMLALLFILIFFCVIYIGYDPNFKFGIDCDASNTTLTADQQDECDFVKNIVNAVLGTLVVIIAITLTKAVVCVEGDTGTLSMNMVVFMFGDPTFLSQKGFRVVHMSQLLKYINENNRRGRCPDPDTFSWDEIHKLPREPVYNPTGCKKWKEVCLRDPFMGTKMAWYLRPLKNAGHPPRSNWPPKPKGKDASSVSSEDVKEDKQKDNLA